jgi:hypothetical protein
LVFFFGDSLGLLGANFAGVLITYLSILISYIILRSYIDYKHLLIGLLFALMLNKWFPFIYYNNLTSLFFIASAFFLYSGLKNDKNCYIIISGFLLGLNIFIRFPNILGFLLLLGIFFYGYMNKSRIRIQFKQAFSFISGYIIAILSALMVMKLVGHYDFFIDAVKTLFSITVDKSGDRYNVKGMISIYYLDYLKVIGFTVVAIPIMIITPKLFMRFKNRYLYYSSIILLITSISAIFALALFRYYDITRFLILLVVGILYLILLLYIINAEKSSKELRLICFIALLILIITPMGSTVGLRNAIYGMWIPVPIAFTYILNLKKITIGIETTNDSFLNHSKISLNHSETRLTKKIFFTLLAILLILSSFMYTYRDNHNRFLMRYSIKNTRLKGIFTTKERAKVVQELLDEMKYYVKENDYLLMYDEMSMIYFLTKTRPYLYNSQPTLYRTEKLKEMLNKSIREKPYLPVIVSVKTRLWDFDWPNGNYVKK